MYFNAFPKITYSLDDGDTVQVVTDITRRVGFIKEFIKNHSYYDNYDVKDGETPEILADIFYGSSFYHWIILHANDIIDPRYDWPLSEEVLKSYCIRKYGGENEIYKTKLYTNVENYVVNGFRGLNENTPDPTTKQENFLVFEDGTNFLLKDPPVKLYPVSRYEYEIILNEEKRRIILPKAEIISTIQSNFTSLIVQ